MPVAADRSLNKSSKCAKFLGSVLVKLDDELDFFGAPKLSFIEPRIASISETAVVGAVVPADTFDADCCRFCSVGSP